MDLAEKLFNTVELIKICIWSSRASRSLSCTQLGDQKVHLFTPRRSPKDAMLGVMIAKQPQPGSMQLYMRVQIHPRVHQAHRHNELPIAGQAEFCTKAFVLNCMSHMRLTICAPIGPWHWVSERGASRAADFKCVVFPSCI